MQQKTLRIILADDDFDEIDLLKTAFEKNPNFEVISCANNGQEIIDAVQNTKILPDVILTDMYMPVLNGLEAIEIIRMEDKNKSIGIIIFSTTINPAITEKAAHLAITGTLLKPFLMEDYQTLPNKVIAMLNENTSQEKYLSN